MPRLGITGLLNDFQYVWLRRLDIPYNYEVLDFARALCNVENTTVFKMTKSNSVNDVRKKLSKYIKKHHRNDNRVILSLHFDGNKINAKWVEVEEYVGSGPAA